MTRVETSPRKTHRKVLKRLKKIHFFRTKSIQYALKTTTVDEKHLFLPCQCRWHTRSPFFKQNIPEKDQR